MSTRIDEIAAGIYRISTPVPPAAVPIPGGFSFNQYLIAGDEPLLFHTGQRALFPAVRAAITTVLPPESLRWIAYSHVEADETGSLDDFLAIASNAQPLTGHVGAMLLGANRPARGLADGEVVSIGRHQVRWHDAPHVPHGWDCGFLSELSTRTLFCGDLFTQPGTGDTVLTESDILAPSEAMRAAMDYYAHGPQTAAVIKRLATTEPSTLACMHGSAFRGDCAAALRALASVLGTPE